MRLDGLRGVRTVRHGLQVRVAVQLVAETEPEQRPDFLAGLIVRRPFADGLYEVRRRRRSTLAGYREPVLQGQTADGERRAGEDVELTFDDFCVERQQG